MKLLDAAPEGQTDDGIWNVVNVTFEIAGEPVAGQIKFEIDGRDSEVEGPLAAHEINWEALWADHEACEKIEAAIEACGG